MSLDGTIEVIAVAVDVEANDCTDRCHFTYELRGQIESAIEGTEAQSKREPEGKSTTQAQPHVGILGQGVEHRPKNVCRLL